MKISVIICTHNPRSDYLQLTIEGIRLQSLPVDQWELLLIDNNSDEHLSEKWDLSWHPNARHIREDELGLTSARLCGIRNAQGEILIFVDDDNILNLDYLSIACDLAEKHPWIGAFGGTIFGEFEEAPNEEIRLMLPYLAIREITAKSWACQPGTRALHSAPCGAGMVIHRTIAEAYVEKVQSDPLRSSLGRRASSLASAEDSDMALVACDMGFAIGVFPQLILKHLIPAQRLRKDYLIRLAEEMRRSDMLLVYIWENQIPYFPMATAPGRAERLLRFYQRIRLFLRGTPIQRNFQDEINDAMRRGEADAVRILQELGKLSN